ncbi:MAG: ATP-grasp domain-containing protein, partial [Planctomycetota bacterium]
MFILEEPYVSPQLGDAATRLGAPVLSTGRARRVLPEASLASDFEFAAAWRGAPDARLYTNSENALDWICEHLSDTALPGQIEAMKDKVRFRELSAADDPGYQFREVALEDLVTFDPSVFAGPFVAKPAVGFFSLGVEFVESPDGWPAAASRVGAAARRFGGGL